MNNFNDDQILPMLQVLNFDISKRFYQYFLQ